MYIYLYEGVGVWFIRLKLTVDDPPLFRELIGLFRAYVHKDYRSFNGYEKRWEVDASAIAQLTRWVRHVEHRYGAVVVVETDPGPEPQRDRRQRQPSLKKSFAVLHLLPSAPPQVVKAAFKALSTIHHPDAGGSHAEMVALNLAYAAISKEVAA